MCHCKSRYGNDGNVFISLADAPLPYSEYLEARFDTRTRVSISSQGTTLNEYLLVIAHSHGNEISKVLAFLSSHTLFDQAK